MSRDWLLSTAPFGMAPDLEPAFVDSNPTASSLSMLGANNDCYMKI